MSDTLTPEAALALALDETEGEWRGCGSSSWMAKVVWPVMEAHLATPPVPAGDERERPYRIARTRREEVILSWAGGEVTTEARDRLLASLDTPGACPSCDGTGFQSDAAGVRLTEGGNQ